ncbi:MAG: carbohydrate binding domain-containing protein, partial [Lentisphaeria bacterium]|nr:carbohydrate binding domain-containing protein [Lentisphaeria bacterium]
MKKSIIIGILFGFLTLTAGNIIRNGDFSAGVKHWTFASWLKTPGTRSIKKEGDVIYLSLTNNKSSKSSTMCLQQLKLKSDTTYIFKFRMRTKDVKRNLPNKITHGAGITVIAQKHLFAGAAETWTMIEGTTGWTEYRGTFKTGKLKPGQLVSFYPTLSLATGTADFANISVEEADSGAAAAPVQKKNKVNLFPVEFQNGKYRIAKNFIGTWYCSFNGKAPAGQSVVFELPAGFEALCGAAIRPAEDKQMLWKWSNEKPQIKKLANGLTRYTFVLPKRVVKEWGAWNNTYRIFIKAAGKAGTKGAGRWYADGNMPQPLNLEILPPLDFKGKIPEKFIICPTFVPNLVGAPEYMGDQHINLWKRLSKNQFISLDHWAWRHADQNMLIKKTAGFKKITEIASAGSMPRLGFGRWKYNDPKARKVKFPLCVPRPAREPEETLCPSYVIADPEGYVWDNYFPTLLRERNQTFNLDLIAFDYEPHPNRVCFCPVCLKDFYAFSKLKGPMTREQILSRYSGIWFKFRVEQHRKIIKRFQEACRKHFPRSKTALVTDGLHHTGAALADWCAVDCRLSDNIGLDYMRNMPYFEGPGYFDHTAFNRKQIKTPWFPLIDPTEASRRFYIRYTPNGVKLNVIATAVHGSVGIGFWPNDYFDGAYLHGIVRASRIVGAAEKYYYNGKRCDDAVKFTAKNTVQRELSDDGEKFVLQTPDFT